MQNFRLPSKKLLFQPDKPQDKMDYNDPGLDYGQDRAVL